MIKLINISKTYKNGKSSFNALDKVCLDIGDGELVAITGPSGAGKSTLLHILGLIEDSTTGTFLLDNRDISKTNQKEKAKLRNQNLGFVLQNFGLVDDWSVFRNVSVPLLYSNMNKKEIAIKSKKVLDQLGIYNKCNELAKNLSGGQKQRVAIARAIINKPKIILADEPTGALDQKNTEEIMRIFKNLNKEGVTIIIVTHNPAVASYCDREIKIVDGRIEN